MKNPGIITKCLSSMNIIAMIIIIIIVLELLWMLNAHSYISSLVHRLHFTVVKNGLRTRLVYLTWKRSG